MRWLPPGGFYYNQLDFERISVGTISHRTEVKYISKISVPIGEFADTKSKQRRFDDIFVLDHDTMLMTSRFVQYLYAPLFGIRLSAISSTETMSPFSSVPIRRSAISCMVTIH